MGRTIIFLEEGDEKFTGTNNLFFQLQAHKQFFFFRQRFCKQFFFYEMQYFIVRSFMPVSTLVLPLTE